MAQDQKKAPMSRSAIKREAKFRAGLILESVVAAGWSADPSIVQKYGQEVADVIADEIATIADRFIAAS